MLILCDVKVCPYWAKLNEGTGRCLNRLPHVDNRGVCIFISKPISKSMVPDYAKSSENFEDVTEKWMKEQEEKNSFTAKEDNDGIDDTNE